MSPRTKSFRKVLNPPAVKGFKPFGSSVKDPDKEPVYLFVEEYEALRLCDYDLSNHHDASVMMNVSRPTFTRIYASALRKIATAFVEGRTVSIEGGKVYFDSDWYHCNYCSCIFNNPEKETAIVVCPLCGSKDIAEFEEDPENGDIALKGCEDICVCTSCGYEARHMKGAPCSGQKCPKCNGKMRRKNNTENT